MGPTSTWFRAQQFGEPRVGGEAPVEVGAQRDHDDCSTLRIGGRAGKVSAKAARSARSGRR